MKSLSSKRKSASSILWFTLPAIVMLLAGFGIMIYVAFGPRLPSTDGVLIPIGFATAGLGGALLTRSLISVFALAVYAVIGLIFAILELGFIHPLSLLFAGLILLCLALTQRAES